MADFAILVVSV